MIATEVKTISISVDGVWAGDGKLEEGKIVDCAAMFGTCQEDSEVVYELIEDEIEDGCESLSLEFSGDSVVREITWTID